MVGPPKQSLALQRREHFGGALPVRNRASVSLGLLQLSPRGLPRWSHRAGMQPRPARVYLCDFAAKNLRVGPFPSLMISARGTRSGSLHQEGLPLRPVNDVLVS